jgi:hypothetical protein
MTTFRQRPRHVSHAVALTVGLGLGWLLASGRSPALLAGGGDRFDESVLATGPTFVKYHEGSKIQVAQDAIYFLDYRAGKLLGTVPSMQQLVGGSKILGGFVERDLVSDFKLDLDRGVHPHFLMTTGSMAAGAGNTYGDGWAPLFVFETTTRQVAAYKMQQQMIGTTQQVRFDLIDLKSFAAASKPGP